jgi:hypothetical protein
MSFDNQLLYSRVKNKQKSFDKFCLQSATAFDQELHASDQSTFMAVQEELDIVVNSSITQSRQSVSSKGNTLVSRYTLLYTE